MLHRQPLPLTASSFVPASPPLASLARQALLRRKARKALHALDDHMLKDIGISRSDIERVSRTTGPARFTRFGR